MLRRIAMITMVLALGLSFGCASMSEVQKGAAVGGAIGAAAGGLYGATTSSLNAGEGAGIGFLAGGLIGALVGDQQMIQAYEDKLAAAASALDDCKEALRNCERDGEAKRQEIEILKRRIAELERALAVCQEELAKCKGARIEMELSNDILFGSGKAVLTSAGQQLLDEAAGKIKAAHLDKNIQIEGHTDSDPISASNWRSNWELGAARALAVLHYLKDKHGLDADKLSAATYGSHKPISSDKGRNRRSVIVLYTNWPTN